MKKKMVSKITKEKVNEMIAKITAEYLDSMNGSNPNKGLENVNNVVIFNPRTSDDNNRGNQLEYFIGKTFKFLGMTTEDIVKKYNFIPMEEVFEGIRNKLGF